MSVFIEFINNRKFSYLLNSLLLFSLSSCYFTNSYYTNLENYKKPDFKLTSSDTLYLTNLICPDTSVSKNADRYLTEKLSKLNNFTIINPDSTSSLMKKQNIYSIPYNFEVEQMELLYRILNIKYMFVWYLSRLEQTEVGKDAVVEIVMNIYNLNQKIKVWSCKSKLYLNSPAPKDTPYLYSLNSNNDSIEELIDNIIKNEFSKIYAI